MIHLFLAHGFEEIEALATLDILRRSGLEVQTVSIMGSLQVMGAHNIPVMADILLEDVTITDSQCLVLPGGMPGAQHLLECKPLRDLLLTQHAKGGCIAAICAAPMVLGANSILEGKRATCYPGFENELKGAQPTGEKVVVDGNIITGKGPGAAFDFGYAIAEHFIGNAAVNALKEGMIWA